ncbi:MAG: OmpA family protein [Vicinamibacterales bacterium]
MFRKLLMIVPVAAIVAGGTTACASKKFVRTSVGQVNDKVDSLGRSLEATQERTRQNEAKIADVDQRAQAAAASAQGAAANAQGTAEKANVAAAGAASAATAANTRVEAVDKAVKRIVFEVVLSEDQGNFKFGKKDLPDAAKARLDEMITALKADPKGAYFEIAGYTDSIGTPELNEKLGLERAEAVKRYLYEKHQVPLHKMNAISYGEESPAADNKTSAGRAQNRRVVIKVVV